MARVFYPVIGSDGCRMEEVGVTDFKYEKMMRDTVEGGLGAIFPDLEIVGHEIGLKEYRFDTVAFNVKTKSFVLIEYKKVQNDQALAQGLAYLRVLHGNEGNFLQACKEKSNTKYEKNDVAWNRTKVFLVAPSFTDRLLKAVEQIKEPIELYRITKYENKVVTVEVVVGPKLSDSVKEHENGGADSLYNYLKKVLHEDLYLKKKDSKAYEKWLLKDGKTVCTVAKQQKSLVLCYTTKSLDRDEVDKVFVRYMKENGKVIGKRGSGDYMSKIQSKEDVDRAVKYIEQVCKQKAGSVVSQGPQTRRDALSQDDMAFVTQKGSGRTTELYSELKKILHDDIPNLEAVVMKRYINWKSTTNGASIFTVAVNKNALRLSYNTKWLNVSKNDSFVRHLSGNGKRISVAGLGNYDSKIETSMDVKKVIPYIKKVHIEKVG